MKINDEYANGLMLGVSAIPGAGIGLFTGIPINAGTPVCEYKGDEFYDAELCDDGTVKCEEVTRRYEYLKSAASFKTAPLLYSLIHKPKSVVIDCHPAICKSEMGLGGFINDARNWQNRLNLEGVSGEDKNKLILDAGYNVMFWPVPNKSKFMIQAIRDIEANEEILADYGDPYWEPWIEIADKFKTKEPEKENEPVSA